MKNFDIGILEYTANRFTPIPTNDDFLDNRYEWQMVENGAEWPYYRFFYHLSKWLQPDLIVELGSYQATAAAHFAAGWAKSIVVTIDHHMDPGDEENKYKTQLACIEYPNLHYVRGWSNPELATRESGKHKLGDAPSALPSILAIERKIDILFIDSWHTYENAMSDWKHYQPLLNNPSLVICDDIQGGEGENDPIRGMMRFWSELPEPKFLNANLHPGTNLGFIQI